MRWRLVIAAAATLAMPAQAAVKTGPVGHYVRALAPLAVVSPINLPGLARAYSFRKLKANYAGAAVRLRRTSDNAQTDIGFVGIDLDAGFAAGFCAATTCYVAKWYDQSGNIRDIIQISNTPTDQPQFFAPCINGKACLQVAQATHSLSSASWTPALPVSISRVSSRAGGTGACPTSTNDVTGNRIVDRNPLGYTLAGSAGTIDITVGDASFHAVTGVVNGALSSLSDNGAVTSGNVTGTAAAGGMYLAGPGAGTCTFGEFLAWSGYALTATEVAALTADQRSYWGF
jgi:hypothetical protein